VPYQPPMASVGLKSGDPDVIRTRDPRFRKPVLYPAELRDHGVLILGIALKRKGLPYRCNLVLGRPRARA
jgi:hypothetical protein